MDDTRQSVERVKQMLLKGDFAQVGRWEKANRIKNIDWIIAQAYRELQNQKK